MRLPSPLVRTALALAVKPLLGPPVPIALQRAWLEATATGADLPPRTIVEPTTLGGRPAERVAVAAAGGQLTDVISWTIAVVDGQDLRAGFGAMQPALAGRDHPPVVTVLLVAGLAVPGALVEISAIAVLP